MRTLGLFEAKQKQSEIVERAAEGEHIGITSRSKLAAVVVPAQRENNLKDVFDDIEQTRKRARRPKGFRAKDLILSARFKRAPGHKI